MVFFSVPLFGADVPLIVLWLVAGGAFFTVYLRLVNVRSFAEAHCGEGANVAPCTLPCALCRA